MLSSGANVIIWNEMLSSGANVIIWDEIISSVAHVLMLQSAANVIIWCYHVMLSSGMITPPFLFFLKTTLTHFFAFEPPTVNVDFTYFTCLLTFVRGLRADLDRSGFTSSPCSEEHGVQILDQCRDKCFLSGEEDVFCVLGLKQGRRETVHCTDLLLT